jgi:hypothetical protein
MGGAAEGFVMPLGIDGVRSRMAELQSRLDSISSRPAEKSPTPPPPPMGGGLSFTDALDAAQNPLSGTIGPNGSLGGAIRPMGIDGLNIQPAHSERELRAMAAKIAKDKGLNPRVFEALIEQESGFDPLAQSSVGAKGLTQLMPPTAREVGVSDPFDPIQNMNGGATYLRKMIDQFDGDLPRALAAYNAGPGRVSRSNGIPRIPETQNYVKGIMGKIGQ